MQLSEHLLGVRLGSCESTPTYCWFRRVMVRWEGTRLPTINPRPTAEPTLINFQVFFLISLVRPPSLNTPEHSRLLIAKLRRQDSANAMQLFITREGTETTGESRARRHEIETTKETLKKKNKGPDDQTPNILLGTAG